MSNNPVADAPYVNRALEEQLVEQKVQTYQNTIPQDTQSAKIDAQSIFREVCFQKRKREVEQAISIICRA